MHVDQQRRFTTMRCVRGPETRISSSYACCNGNLDGNFYFVVGLPAMHAGEPGRGRVLRSVWGSKPFYRGMVDRRRKPRGGRGE